MKTTILLILVTLSSKLIAQVPEIKTKTKITEVTVYITGAQIKRSSEIDLNSGKSIVKFVNLSPYIDAKSINIKSTGDFTILSVNHFQNYLKQQTKTKSLNELMLKTGLISLIYQPDLF